MTKKTPKSEVFKSYSRRRQDLVETSKSPVEEPAETVRSPGLSETLKSFDHLDVIIPPAARVPSEAQVYLDEALAKKKTKKSPQDLEMVKGAFAAVVITSTTITFLFLTLLALAGKI